MTTKLTRSNLCLAAAGLLTAWTALAEADPHLGEYLAIAKSQNPTIKAAHSLWQASGEQPGQAGALPDPLVGIEVQQDPSSMGDYTTVAYLAEQEFPWFGLRGANRETAAIMADAEGFRYLEVRRKIIARTTKAYWELWLARRMEHVLADTLEVTRRMQDITTARLEAGRGLQTDLLRTDLEILRMEDELARAKSDTSTRLAALNALLSADPSDERITAEHPPAPLLPGSLEALQEEARQYCCVLMSMLREMEAAESMVKAARLMDRPVFGLRVQARQFEETGDIDEVETALTMRIPLWRERYTSLEEEAERKLDEAQARYQEEVNMTLEEIQDFYLEAQDHLRTLELYEKRILPKAEELASSSREGYQSGTTTALEQLDAERALLEASFARDTALAGFAQSVADLEATAAPWSEEEKATGLPPH